MEFDLWTKQLAAVAVDAVIVGVFEESELTAQALELDRASHGALARRLKLGDFPGRSNETLLLAELPGLAASRVLLVGLGAKDKLNRKSWRRAHTVAVTALAKTAIQSAAFAIARPAAADLDDYHAARSIAELTLAALYRTNDLKSTKKPKAPVLARVLVGPAGGPSGATLAKTLRRGLTHGAGIAAGARVMRDLANLPSNICTPSYIAAQAQQLGKTYAALKVKVLDEAAIRKEKMGCFLTVSQGSEQPPRFIVIEYQGAKAGKAPVVLVGKGITFDTGGISLKDPPGMDEMKFDMSGAASVMGAMVVAAELKLKLNLVALVPACENMPSGRAIKPGDIVTSASGLTVEILNTDAEGRLILCDALHYARRFNPAALVDVATLTGACVIALGAHYAGVMSKDESLRAELVDAGVRADDRCWPMPVGEEYAEQLKSNFADLANVAGREGGACTAASYLSRFTEGMKWAHLDIAGVAYLSGAQKGSTGRPMGLLGDFLIHRAAK